MLDPSIPELALQNCTDSTQCKGLPGDGCLQPKFLAGMSLLLLFKHTGGSSRVVSRLPAEAGSPDTTLDEPHPNSNTQQSKNNTANVVVQQQSRKLLRMDILMPETS